jgi:hypothetical protein
MDITTILHAWTARVATLGLAAILALSGCETDAQSGALMGAGVGALAGQAIGGNTKSTLIGAGIGTGAGYMIGNESDKKKARSYSGGVAPSPELSPLAGSTWMVSDVTMDQPKDWVSMQVSFDRDGYVTTVKTMHNGSINKDRERYRIVGDTLIINDNDYLVNAKWSLTGSRLTLKAEDWQAVLTRTS